jgi:BirA family biotin operon repressor/biotin-[acetyl-CoA-carboxylase] ligase
VDLNRLAAAVIGRVLIAYDMFVAGEHLKTFPDLWHRYDLLRNKSVALIEGGRRHHGTVRGLDDKGALLLRDGQGKTRRFRAGEITLEKAG